MSMVSQQKLEESAIDQDLSKIEYKPRDEKNDAATGIE
jgi:hypothetical protein